MLVSLNYTATHEATRIAADRYKLTPFSVRVLWALCDRGGTASSLELEHDLQIDGSSVRRALLELYATGMANGTGPGGGKRRRGVRTLVSLTPSGRLVVEHAAEARMIILRTKEVLRAA